MSTTEKTPARTRKHSHRRRRGPLEPRRTVKPSGYREYIQSEAWQAIRQKLLASGRKRECYGCGKKDGPKDVHHRTYENLGNERLRDLVFLCRDCHDYVHEIHQNTPSLSLWNATRAVRRQRHPMHAREARRGAAVLPDERLTR